MQPALSRGAAGAISALYFSSWLTLAAVLNVVAAGVTAAAGPPAATRR